MVASQPVSLAHAPLLRLREFITEQSWIVCHQVVLSPLHEVVTEIVDWSVETITAVSHYVPLFPLWIPTFIIIIPLLYNHNSSLKTYLAMHHCLYLPSRYNYVSIK